MNSRAVTGEDVTTRIALEGLNEIMSGDTPIMIDATTRPQPAVTGKAGISSRCIDERSVVSWII